MAKCVARPNTYMIDYIFFGKYYYLLAVNVNTRKAYAIHGFGKYSEETGLSPNSFAAIRNKSNTEEAIGEMQELLKQVRIKYLLSDKETAWTSIGFQEYLKSKRITQHFEVADGNHTTLSVLNRVCRTLRNMLYNMHIPQTQCSPNVMKYIIDEYNKSPHTTLTKIFHHKTSPNDVDEFMESVIIRTAMAYNDSLESNRIPLGTAVLVYNETGTFDKVKPKILDGSWYVEGYSGIKYIVKDSKSKNRLTLSRWMIKPLLI
jgi:hypothetical protein